MEKFFHLQRLLKSLADGVWSLLLPQTTVASLSITDDWWETQHILFSLRPVQGEWRRIWFKDLQTLVDCDKLQPPLSLSLALQAATGSHRWGSAHARLCCRPQLTQVLPHQCARDHLGSAGVGGNCHVLPKHGSVPSPHEEATSVCLAPLSPQKHLWLREGVILEKETTILRKGFPPPPLLFPGLGISSVR